MTKERTSVSIRLSLVDALRAVVSREQSPTGRLFDSTRASRAKICDAALEVAAWCCSGEFGKALVKGYEPEFKERLSEVDKNAYMRGAADACRFLGAAVDVDAEGRVITVTPPAALGDGATGELDSRPLVAPKIPVFH